MSRQNEGKVITIEARARAALSETCRRCWGTGSVIVCVPDPDNAEDAEYAPTACPDCGAELHVVWQVVGIHEDEMP